MQYTKELLLNTTHVQTISTQLYTQQSIKELQIANNLANSRVFRYRLNPLDANSETKISETNIFSPTIATFATVLQFWLKVRLNRSCINVWYNSNISIEVYRISFGCTLSFCQIIYCFTKERKTTVNPTVILRNGWLSNGAKMH